MDNSDALNFGMKQTVNCCLVSDNDPDFKAGVASLAQLLNIPPHPDHLVVLKVSDFWFAEQHG